MSTTPEHVTVIGLGNLGRALAETFLRHGHPTTVWNRDANKADALVAAGAKAAATAEEAIAAGDLVIVALLDSTVARRVLAGAAGAVAGRALVNVTSGGPEDARELAAWADEHGARYLHGAVYAVPQTIGTAGSSISYSGEETVHRRWQPLLDLLGRGTFLGRDAGLASGYDVAILAGMYGMIGGFLHATAMAAAAGVRATELTPMLLSWLTDSFPALSTFAEEIDSGGFSGGESSLAMNQAGLATIIRASRELGVPVGTLAPVKDLIDRQIDDGHGAASLSRAVESFRSAA
ncbi:NAD(P)-dependent oxidoreductase [Amycolatopsis umgeniensis]|uniref:3-hydroxyisobutyrate dehydrogenase-like beta-hydroxyacid dehydrogenase n=1 Tax=Amycolatopsis umgeniensis TaxID=336628 RepID=A0A841BAF5_9PSEU|nr:NAD(P)-binding domain-containing protein [Amycolatopsis umgeniensis]MBB5856277.1 3-hydroxyisobutyrate dehydrogenase-like beta-hydroxyacid dehydrogenase [Amycolatopsis umgeniensis]